MGSSSPWVVVGLGNPGSQYAATRHNVGAMVADLLVDRAGGRLSAHRRARAEVMEGRLAGERVVVARPRSYMNESGGPVAGLLAYYQVPADRLLVLHDELDIPFGAVRLKYAGGLNGHNGLKSIRRSLGTDAFFRERIGIGRPPGRQDPVDFVLAAFGSTERKELPLLIERAADAVELLLSVGLERAQNSVHTDSATGATGDSR